MPLKEYQQEIELDTLYEIKKLGGVSGLGDQIAPNIFIDGGTADVYVSNGEEPSSAPTAMNIIENGEDLAGVASFAIIPRYLYVTENTATVNSVILSGIEAISVD